MKIILDDHGLDKAIERVPHRVRRELGDGMDRIGKGFLKRWRKARLHGPPGVRGKSGHGLFGTFKRASIFGKNIDDMGVHIWSDSKVALVHEEGGDVRAEGGGRLTIPLSAREHMFTTAGKLRKRFKRPGKLRGVVPMRWRGKSFLVKVNRRRRDILPLYVLKEKVRLKPRLEFIKTWNGLSNYRTKIINDKIKIALKEL